MAINEEQAKRFGNTNELRPKFWAMDEVQEITRGTLSNALENTKDKETQDNDRNHRRHTRKR